MFVLPVRHSLSGREFAPVIFGIVVLNVLVAAGVALDSSASSIFREYGYVPSRGGLLTLVTSQFLHGGFWHLVGNMFFLWIFGVAVEHAIGAAWTFGLYLSAGVMGNLIWGDLMGGDIPAIGASGAISGIVGAYAILFPDGKVDLLIYLWRFHVATIPATPAVAVLVWLAEQTLLSFFVKFFALSMGIAFAAHMGGLVAGLGFAWLIRRSQLSSTYLAMAARIETPSLRCPRCGSPRPNRGIRAYLCPNCRTWFELDEEGQISLAKPRPPVQPQADDVSPGVALLLLLGLALVIGLMVWVQL